MKPEDKELLLKDLCARLPYGVKVQYNGSSIRLIQAIGIEGNEPYFKSKEVAGWLDVGSCKPYLRPISSITNDEWKELMDKGLAWDINCGQFCFIEDQDIYDWFDANHFDYRRLIGKGLAIEVTEENNPYKD